MQSSFIATKILDKMNWRCCL